MNIPYIFKQCAKCGEWLVANGINFNKAKKGKYGLTSQCKKCIKQYREDNKEQLAEKKKQYREKNKEQLAEKQRQHYKNNREQRLKKRKEYYENNKEQELKYRKQYYQENKEHYSEYKKQYYQENKEYYSEYYKQYYQENKEQKKEYYKQYYQSPQGQVALFNSHNKRRKQEEEQGRGITSEQWVEMMNWFGWSCAYSGMYIGGANNNNRTIDHIIALDNGGLNEPWNCIPMYKPYNSSKWKKDMLEWYQQQPFFSEERLAKIYEWQEYAFNKWGQDIAM